MSPVLYSRHSAAGVNAWASMEPGAGPGAIEEELTFATVSSEVLPPANSSRTRQGARAKSRSPRTLGRRCSFEGSPLMSSHRPAQGRRPVQTHASDGSIELDNRRRSQLCKRHRAPLCAAVSLGAVRARAWHAAAACSVYGRKRPRASLHVPKRQGRGEQNMIPSSAV
jgi:hypothetical protein